MHERTGHSGQRSTRYRFDDVVVDLEEYRVIKAGQVRPLGPRAFDLLLDLIGHAGRVRAKDDLIERVWKGVAVTDNALARAIRELREAIGDAAGTPRYVQTVPRRGYRFVAQVQEIGAPARIMLAVLPFENLGREPEDYLCDGLTEEMIARLATLNTSRLGVIARTSAMTYKGSRKGIAEIARDLRVDYVVEGSVRRDGGRVRITVQLIDVEDQSHVWSGTYDEDLGNLLRTQARAAEAIARAIQVQLQPDAGRWQSIRSVDAEAYAAYLKGRYSWNQRTATGVREAIGAYERALALEPTFAPAHTGLARCYGTFILGILPRQDAEPKAWAAIARSLELDPEAAETHATLGAFESIDGNLPAAERAFRHALALDRNDATAHHWYAMHCLVEMGRFDAALDELRIAQSLDPLALIIAADVAGVHCLQHDAAAALAQCRRVLELDPAFARAHLYAGWAWGLSGDGNQAVGAFETARRLDDTPWSIGWLGFGYGSAGRRDDAERMLAELRRCADLGREVAFPEALVRCGLDEIDQAFACLDRARGERSLAFNVARYLPALDRLRHDRRFDLLVSPSGSRRSDSRTVDNHHP